MRHFSVMLGGDFAREFTSDALPEPLSLLYQWHRAYFCPVCASVWAKWTIEGASHYTSVHRSCPTHRHYSFETPGSLLVDTKLDLSLLPLPLLMREYNLRFKDSND